MREIEIKARVNDAASVLQKLKAHGVKLGEAKTQHDIVYGEQRTDGSWGKHWLRVRTQDSRFIFTYKRSVTSELDSIEHETAVENGEAMIAILKDLGFSLYSDLTKVRRTGHAGAYELCFDEVPPLGTFIEIESLTTDDIDGEQVMKDMRAFLEKLGISENDRVMSGYDVLMRQHEGLDA